MCALSKHDIFLRISHLEVIAKFKDSLAYNLFLSTCFVNTSLSSVDFFIICDNFFSFLSTLNFLFDTCALLMRRKKYLEVRFVGFALLVTLAIAKNLPKYSS